MNKIDNVLNLYLAPDPEDDDPVDIFVTADMVRDLKDLRLGYNGDTSYATCHRGISPFAVSFVDQEEASRRKRARERASRVTFLTSADVMGLESYPDTCPTQYDPMMRLLLAYRKFLKVLSGTRCEHYVEVVAIRRVLAEKRQWFQSMSARAVVELLWAIFVDARLFYGARLSTTGELPKSNLRLTRHWLAQGQLMNSLTCPWRKLIGSSVPPTVSDNDSGLSSLSDIFDEVERKPAAGAATKINTTFNASLAGVTKELLNQHPTVTMAEVMGAVEQPAIRYHDVKLGLGGSCLDMHYFGRCTNAQCTYKHAAQAAPSTTRVRQVVGPVKKAVAAYLAAN
jgi:hypothetical protein